MRRFKVSNVELAAVIVLSALIGGMVSAGLENPMAVERLFTVTPEGFQPQVYFADVSTTLVAVDQEGNGVTTPLRVRTVPGTGQVMVNIESLLFFVDTQFSIQKAVRVAQDHLNVSVKDTDFIYSIAIPNTSIVGGESAGAAFAVAAVAALENKTLPRTTMMTGTIDEEGNIGPVGGILAKAKAAKAAGATLFLVPRGQGSDTTYQKVETCDTSSGTRVCRVEFKPQRISIGSSVGIDVEEVRDLEEAINKIGL